MISWGRLCSFIQENVQGFCELVIYFEMYIVCVIVVIGVEVCYYI